MYTDDKQTYEPYLYRWQTKKLHWIFQIKHLTPPQQNHLRPSAPSLCNTLPRSTWTQAQARTGAYKIAAHNSIYQTNKNFKMLG